MFSINSCVAQVVFNVKGHPHSRVLLCMSWAIRVTSMICTVHNVYINRLKSTVTLVCYHVYIDWSNYSLTMRLVCV